MIILQFGFHLFADGLRFETPSSFVALHSSEFALPHLPRELGFVVVAQHLAEVQFLLPFRTLRDSFVIRKDGLND